MRTCQVVEEVVLHTGDGAPVEHAGLCDQGFGGDHLPQLPAGDAPREADSPGPDTLPEIQFFAASMPMVTTPLRPSGRASGGFGPLRQTVPIHPLLREHSLVTTCGRYPESTPVIETGTGPGASAMAEAAACQTSGSRGSPIWFP